VLVVVLTYLTCIIMAQVTSKDRGQIEILASHSVTEMTFLSHSRSFVMTLLDSIVWIQFFISSPSSLRLFLVPVSFPSSEILALLKLT